MTKPAHEPYDELCFSVYTTNRYFHHLYSKILSQYDLTYLQYMVLIVVRNEEQIPLSTICSKLDLANNTLTPVIQKLVDKKWLSKKRSAKDSRCLEISLDRNSFKTLKDIRNKVWLTQQMFSELAKQSIEELIEQHHKLNSELIEISEKLAEKL